MKRPEILDIHDVLYMSKLQRGLKRAWVVPTNDLEGQYIIALLREKKEEVYELAAPWGVTWQQVWLEFADLQNYTGLLLGIEIGEDGRLPHTHSIDHHYGLCVKSSLEQVAILLGVTLDLEYSLVAANDRGYIPEMYKMLEKSSMTTSEKEQVVCYIRQLDRACQGITPEEEELALLALRTAVYVEGGVLKVEMTHNKCAPITDRMYEENKDTPLLIVSKQDGVIFEVNFYASKVEIDEIETRFTDYKYYSNTSDSNGYIGTSDSLAIPVLLEKIKQYAGKK